MDDSYQEVLTQIRQMDEFEFEELVAEVWEQHGWDTAVTTKTSDGGVDVVAEKHSPFFQKIAIQAKRYNRSNKIGGPDVREYASVKEIFDDIDSVIVVTTSSFSSQADKMARKLDVKLIDGAAFVRMLKDIDGSTSLVQHYTDSSTGASSPTESDNTYTDDEHLPGYVTQSTYTVEPPVEYLRGFFDRVGKGEVKDCFYSAEGIETTLYPEKDPLRPGAVHIFTTSGFLTVLGGVHNPNNFDRMDNPDIEVANTSKPIPTERDLHDLEDSYDSSEMIFDEIISASKSNVSRARIKHSPREAEIVLEGQFNHNELGTSVRLVISPDSYENKSDIQEAIEPINQGLF